MTPTKANAAGNRVMTTARIAASAANWTTARIDATAVSRARTALVVQLTAMAMAISTSTPTTSAGPR